MFNVSCTRFECELSQSSIVYSLASWKPRSFSLKRIRSCTLERARGFEASRAHDVYPNNFVTSVLKHATLFNLFAHLRTRGRAEHRECRECESR